ncbi:hypothetical protein [Rhizobium sp.]
MQALKPPPACILGKADPFREIPLREARIGLHGRQDLHIKTIDFYRIIDQNNYSADFFGEKRCIFSL